MYFAAARQHSYGGATDISQPMTDMDNRGATAIYERLDVNTHQPVSYQQLPPQTGHDRDYYNLGSSANTDDISPYEQLDISIQRPAVYVYEQLETQHRG